MTDTTPDKPLLDLTGARRHARAAASTRDKWALFWLLLASIVGQFVLDGLQQLTW